MSEPKSLNRNDELLNSDKSKLRYYAYLRKSSEDEEKQVLSIESQKDEIKKHFPDFKILDFLPEEKSAFVPNQRPVLEFILKQIDEGKADGILAWHPDRLSRNEVDAAQITIRVRTNIIKDLQFASFTFQNSPEGIMFLQMTMSQSQYFSSKLSKDVKRGVEKKLRLGWWPGLAPVGYINSYDPVSQLCFIEKDLERFDLIRKAWELLLSGSHTVPSIWKVLKDDWGLKTIQRRKIGGTPLAKSGLYRVFTNPFYTGLMPIKGELIPGSHEPMIGLEEFDHAQKILGRKGRPRPKKHVLPFTGVIRCGECGCQISGDIKHKKIKSSGKVRFYTYYKCTRKKVSVNCSQASAVREEELEEMIKQLLDEITIIPEFRDFALKALKDDHENEKRFRERVERNLHIAINSAQKHLDDLVDMRLNDLLTDEEYKIKKEEYQNKLVSQRKKLEENFTRAEQWLENTEKVFDFASRAKAAFDKGSVQTKKEILVALGQNPTMKDKKLTLEFNKWFVPIARGGESIKPKVEPSISPEKPLDKRKNTSFDTDVVSWLGSWDSNPEPID